jgi:hypothetical protein
MLAPLRHGAKGRPITGPQICERLSQQLRASTGIQQGPPLLVHEGHGRSLRVSLDVMRLWACLPKDSRRPNMSTATASGVPPGSTSTAEQPGSASLSSGQPGTAVYPSAAARRAGARAVGQQHLAEAAFLPLHDLLAAVDLVYPPPSSAESGSLMAGGGSSLDSGVEARCRLLCHMAARALLEECSKQFAAAVKDSSGALVRVLKKQELAGFSLLATKLGEQNREIVVAIQQ